MKKFTMGSILALLLLAVSACAPGNQNGSGQDVSGSSDAIIGGKTVSAGSTLSKQVFMLFAISGDGSQAICTATLLTRQHVLTAAHCVDGVKKMFAVFAVDAIGKLEEGNPMNDPDIIVITSGRVFPKWKGSKDGAVTGVDAGDIAVLRLAKPAPAHMKVTKLHTTALRRGQVLVASGYGTTSGTKSIGSGVLRETTVVVEEPIIGKSEFYVDQKSGRGICSGDSGGPSFVRTSFGEMVQVGVTSRGDQKCAIGGLYTLVPAFSTWINDTVRTLTK